MTQSRMHRGDPAIECLNLLHVMGTQPLGVARLPLSLLLCFIMAEDSSSIAKRLTFHAFPKSNSQNNPKEGWHKRYLHFQACNILFGLAACSKILH